MNVSSPEFDLEAVTSIFERLTHESASPLDRSQIRRALEEAALVWPDETGNRWWQWIVEASQSLGRKSRVIDATADQVIAAVHQGAEFITCLPEGREWVAITSYSHRKLTLHRPLGHPQVTLRKDVQVAQWLRGLQSGETIRCVIIEPGLILDPAVDAHGATPWQRLLGLLRAERSDIWHLLVFALVTGVLSLATPLAIESLVNTVAFGRFLQPIVVLALLLLGFLIFSAALRALQVYVAEIVQRRLFVRVAADLAFRLPRMRNTELDGHAPREMVNRFFDVLTVQKAVSQLLLDGVTLVLNALIGLMVLGFYHPWLLGFDVVLCALITFAIFVLGRGAVKSSIKESKVKYHTAAWLEEIAASPIAFRLDGASEFALERTDRLLLEYLSARKKHFRILIRQILFALGLQAVASTVLLGLGGWLVVQGQLTLGQLVAAELIVTVVVGSFAKLGKHLESFYDLLAAVDKLGVLMDVPLEEDGKLLDVLDHRPAEVTFQQLSLSAQAPFGWQPLDAQVASGGHLAIVGPSGCGKSWLLELLYGMRDAASGHVLINQIDPRTLRADVLRRYVALVRDIEYFEGTLADQVHMERPEITSGDVREALLHAGILDTILRLPRGLETAVNGDGGPLTPNQWRRVMLARAIVGRPCLLLIDGTLDTLPDEEAESLLGWLTAPERPWTLILVTGRASLRRALLQLRLDPREAPT